MLLDEIEVPRYIHINGKVLENIGNVCKKLNLGKRCIVLGGPTTSGLAGKRVRVSLEEAGFGVSEIVSKDVSNDALDSLTADTKGFDFFAGVGGGRIIDTAKLLSYRNAVPFISIPTTLSHDGIASSRVTLNNNGHHYSSKTHPPLAVFIDLSVVSTSPYELIAAGCGDMTAKITAVRDWELASVYNGEKFSKYIAGMTEGAANSVLDNSEKIRKMDIDGLKVLAEAIVSSGIAMCLTGSSRPASGSEHLFSHALDSIIPGKKSLHGQQTAVGSILCAYLHRLDWQGIRDKLIKLSLPTTAEQLGVGSEDIVEALVKAKNIRDNRYTILNQVNLDERKAEEIARKTGVI